MAKMVIVVAAVVVSATRVVTVTFILDKFVQGVRVGHVASHAIILST